LDLDKQNENYRAGFTPREREVLKLYDDLAAKAAAEPQDDIVRRPKAATDPRTGKPTVDLSKADADCERCDGTGLRGTHKVVLDGVTEMAPVICVCVSENGGVRRDALDRMVDRVAKHIKRQAKKTKKKRRRR
jgi:hypothetical protein